MAGIKIEMENLPRISRALKTADADLPKRLRLALNEVADAVLAEARPLVPTRTGRAARSLRAKSTRTKARVAGGSARAPYYPWLDFGGRVGRGNSVSRPYRRDGRYIYPTYFRMRASGEFEERFEKAITELVEAAGLEVD